jgi:branched-chain amino acid transport system substrate-binding protein
LEDGRLKFAPAYFLTIVSGILLMIVTTACQKSNTTFGCQDDIGCVRIAPGEPIKIGVLQALSGKVKPLGQAQLHGIFLAVEKHGGKIKGHPITMQTEDTGCTAEGGANAALKLIAHPQTVAILGTTCSSAAATASQAMSNAGMTMISGNNSAPYLTAIAGRKAPDWQPGYFRTAFNEESSGKTAATYAFQKLGIHRAATINDGDIYTKGLTDGFERVFEQLGGKIVLSTAVDKGDKEMQPVIKAVLNARAQLLFFPLFQPEGNYLLLKARKTPGFENIVLMSDGALIENSFIEDVQLYAQGMYFVGPAAPSGPRVDMLAEAYGDMFKEKPATNYYLIAYDAADLLLTTLSKVAVPQPDGSLSIGRQALRRALYATKDFQGVSGMLTCDQFGDCADPIFNVLRLEDPDKGVTGLLSNVLYTSGPEKPSIQ